MSDYMASQKAISFGFDATLEIITRDNQKLALTTPYLVPDDSMLPALRGAAGRGVSVTIILSREGGLLSHPLRQLILATTISSRTQITFQLR